MKAKFTAALLLCLSLCACSVGPDYERPDVALPDAWRIGTSDQGSIIGDGWWRTFNDETLNILVDEALAYNQNLAMAIANVDIARAQLGMARSDQLPTIDVGGAASRTSQSPNSPSYVVGSPREVDLWQFNGLLSFEIDLWGKYRRASEAALASLLATQAAQDTVRLSVISQVVNTYFALRALDMQVLVAETTLKNRQQSEEIIGLRYTVGEADELDYQRAKAETNSTALNLRQYQNAQAGTENSLAVLLGRSPRDIVQKPVARGQAIDKTYVPAYVPAGLGLNLLSRRPDIWQAEQELVAANANIGVAKAALFPSISLTGLLGFESASFGQLFNRNSSTWAFGGSLSMPLLNLSVWYSYSASQAQARYALANYINVLQTAYAETQSALINNQKMREVLVFRQAQVQALRRALALATLRYDNGYSDYLEVLDAERSLFSAETSLAGDYQNQLTAVSNLCRALGGGWMEPGAHSDDRQNDQENPAAD